MEEPCTSISFNKDGFTIGVGTTEGNVFILDLRNLKEPLRVLEGHSGESIADVSFN
jgi:WD40 repeat protein